MTLSTPGLIGAGIGVAIALVTYLGVASVWSARLTSTSIDADQRLTAEQQWSTMRLVLLADFVILAALGYYVGDIAGA